MNIESKRLYITYFSDEYVDACMEYRNDLEWMCYQGFKGLKREEFAQRLLKPIDFTSGMQLAILDKDTKCLIGDLYLKQENNTTYRIGYTISEKYARNGYASEAINTVMEYLSKRGITCFLASVVNENIPSIRLLEKLGFIFISIDNFVREYIKE